MAHRQDQQRRASIHDVASRAGVSAATVSKVMAGVTTVKPENAQRVLDAIERLGETPRDVLRISLDVRRRVQFLATLMAFGWAAVLVAVQLTSGWPELRLLGYPLTIIAVVGALVSVGLLWFSILEVRRLPSESEAGRWSHYPRRLR